MTHTLLLDPESGSTQEAFHASLAPDLADQFEQVMQRDRSFFLQHPDQDYYVRPITPVEVLEGQALGKEVHEQARVLVGEVVPGSRRFLMTFHPRSRSLEPFSSSCGTRWGRRLQRSKTAFKTIKNLAQNQKDSEPRNRGDPAGTYPFILINLLILIVFLLR